MKKYLLGATILALVAVALLVLSRPKLEVDVDGGETSAGLVLSKGDESSGRDVVVGDKHYQVVWKRVDVDGLLLIPNFEDKKTAKDVFEENACELLVSGGFYSEDSWPIGYFVFGGEVLSQFSQSKLFDGVLSVNSMGTPRITRTPPRDPILVGLQTGPMLQENDTKIELELVRDKPARRMIAAVTGGNELLLMTVYSLESAFSGPMLGQLPEIISKLEEEENLNIADAINLDGGSASAFISDDFSLSEASPVGSFFCAR
jgi:hypothetical protein